MIEANAIQKIVDLVRPPVAEAEGAKYILKGYEQAIPMSPDFALEKEKQDAELSVLLHEQALAKEKLSFNVANEFSRLHTLSGLCDMLQAEIDRNAATFPLFVNVADYNLVTVIGSYEVDFSRRSLYSSKSDNHEFDFGMADTEAAIITLQTKYVVSDDLEYVIGLCSKVTDKTEVSAVDNGLSQSVTVVKGVATLSNEKVRPRVKLRPFRTFIEVEQPASEFLLRFHDNGRVSLTGADGGAWKLTAKATIAEYLREKLANLIESKKVIVTM
ncbi:MAG: hypothetical protein LBT88_08160 [Oscillospiraceae bacterium]|jgi:hypothetical protein|nr:hypothetical protein [Oscillospiraceae bacterium]